MKKCEHFKDLILTDYVDGQLDRDLSGSVEGHLLDCSDCRAFFKEVKNNTLPFQKIMPQPVPAELWDTIRQTIEHEKQRTGFFPAFLDKLKGLIFFPRMIPVFASLVVMLLVGSMTINQIQIRQAQAKDQGEYLVSLLSTTGGASPGESNDLGTPIEHYFL